MAIRPMSSGVKTSDTAVKSASGVIHWITVSDVTAASQIQINDSTDDSGTDLWTIELPANGYVHCLFPTPLFCGTGIYLDVPTGSPSVVIGYT